MKRALPCFVLIACALVSASARGNPFGYHEHDGFYLRMSVGGASLDIQRRTEAGTTGSVAFAKDASRIRGASLYTEVSVGGTPLPGFVLAATLLGNGIPAAELRVASGSRLDLGTPLFFAMLGPTVDVYPNPARGFHVGGGIGLATSTAGVEDPIFNSIGGLGAGLTLTFGYDFWISDDWSVGVAARGILARIDGQNEADKTVGLERDTISSASIAATLLYH